MLPFVSTDRRESSDQPSVASNCPVPWKMTDRLDWSKIRLTRNVDVRLANIATDRLIGKGVQTLVQVLLEQKHESHDSDDDASSTDSVSDTEVSRRLLLNSRIVQSKASSRTSSLVHTISDSEDSDIEIVIEPKPSSPIKTTKTSNTSATNPFYKSPGRISPACPSPPPTSELISQSETAKYSFSLPSVGGAGDSSSLKAGVGGHGRERETSFSLGQISESRSGLGGAGDSKSEHEAVGGGGERGTSSSPLQISGPRSRHSSSLSQSRTPSPHLSSLPDINPSDFVCVVDVSQGYPGSEGEEEEEEDQLVHDRFLASNPGVRLKRARINIKEDHCVRLKTPKLRIIESRAKVRRLFKSQRKSFGERVRLPKEYIEPKLVMACPFAEKCNSTFAADDVAVYNQHVLNCVYANSQFGPADLSEETAPQENLYQCPRCVAVVGESCIESHLYQHLNYGCHCCTHRYDDKMMMEDHIINDHATHFMSNQEPYWRMIPRENQLTYHYQHEPGLLKIREAQARANRLAAAPLSQLPSNRNLQPALPQHLQTLPQQLQTERQLQQQLRRGKIHGLPGKNVQDKPGRVPRALAQLAPAASRPPAPPAPPAPQQAVNIFNVPTAADIPPNATKVLFKDKSSGQLRVAYVVAAPGNVVADSTARAAIAAASVQSQSKSSESAAGGKVWRQVWRPPQPQISAATAQYNLLSSTKSCKTQLTPRGQPNSSQVPGLTQPGSKPTSTSSMPTVSSLLNFARSNFTNKLNKQRNNSAEPAKGKQQQVQPVNSRLKQQLTVNQGGEQRLRVQLAQSTQAAAAAGQQIRHARPLPPLQPVDEDGAPILTDEDGAPLLPARKAPTTADVSSSDDDDTDNASESNVEEIDDDEPMIIEPDDPLTLEKRGNENSPEVIDDDDDDDDDDVIEVNDSNVVEDDPLEDPLAI